MTRYSSTYTTTTATTAALYNAHFGKFSLALQAVLTKTADTGQAVFGTTAGSGTLGTFYEVYAFNDSLQATRPIYLRVDYLAGGSADAYLTVGTSTDGAGTIGGQWLTQVPLLSSGPSGQVASGSLVRTVYSSGDGSYASLVTNVSTATNSYPALVDNLGAVIIERTRDLDGTPNGNGVMIYRWRGYFDSYNNNLTLGSALTATYAGSIARAFDTVSPAYGPDMDLNALLPMRSQVNSYAYLGQAMTWPVYGHTAAGAIQGASKALMAGFITDWPLPKQPTAVSHYGATMTFLPMGQYAPLYTSSISNPPVANVGGATGSARLLLCPLFRWE